MKAVALRWYWRIHLPPSPAHLTIFRTWKKWSHSSRCVPLQDWNRASGISGFRISEINYRPLRTCEPTSLIIFNSDPMLGLPWVEIWRMDCPKFDSKIGSNGLEILHCMPPWSRYHFSLRAGIDTRTMVPYEECHHRVSVLKSHWSYITHILQTCLQL